jgi:hypothetical protein
MINRIHRFMHSIERGFDPVPAEHVRFYADSDSALPGDPAFLPAAAELGRGAGHGRFSHYFHDCGAQVPWLDILWNCTAHHVAKWNDGAVSSSSSAIWTMQWRCWPASTTSSRRVIASAAA